MSVIFHIDMNSYFATVEQQANPHLRGKPIGVCEHLGGIIIAPSIEAKKLGIKTATPVWEARKICPDIVLLPVDPPKVRSVTERFLKIFSEYTDVVERYSIDEVFLDISNLLDYRHSDLVLVGEEFSQTGDYKDSSPPEADRDDRAAWDQALLYALEIKQRIRREIGEWLTCSVGIAPNKLIAKIASGIDKPDGLTLIRPRDIPDLYHRIALTDIPGIGARMAQRLAMHKIFTPSDLKKYPESRLRAEFGLVGHHLAQLGRFEGMGDFTVPEQETVKSIGHSYTLPRATSDEKEIKKLLFKLSEKVALRLRHKNMWGSVVSCNMRFVPTFLPSPLAELRDPKGRMRGQSFNFSRCNKINDFINDGRLIFGQAWKLYKFFSSSPPAIFLSPPARGGVRGGGSLPVRMLGVTVSGLVENLADEPLFERYKKPQRALLAMDKVNNKHGDFTLRRAILLDAKSLAADTVGFGRLAL